MFITLFSCANQRRESRPRKFVVVPQWDVCSDACDSDIIMLSSHIIGFFRIHKNQHPKNYIIKLSAGTQPEFYSLPVQDTTKSTTKHPRILIFFPYVLCSYVLFLFKSRVLVRSVPNHVAAGGRSEWLEVTATTRMKSSTTAERISVGNDTCARARAHTRASVPHLHHTSSKK